MRRALILAAFVLMSFVPVQAFAAWGLGANLGMTLHNPAETGSDNVTLIGFPSQASVFTSLRPGLRVGFAGDSSPHEVYLDVSLDHEASGGDSFTAVRLGGNYQYNFSGTSFRPYLTAGLGVFSEHADFSSSTSATSMTFGGGAGVGFPIGDQAGRLRLEARYDKLQEGKDNGDVVIGEAGITSLLFGFDLWLR
ncbi:MAG TPA: outer membrane beta-barrel protein [Candidatus Eisenbacteria bacterium]|nr:outer membrane beta-barrel protein [Candidatus Eisenbacteria bacterium]